MTLDPATSTKLRMLEEWFKQAGSVVVAFSGGVDSTLVAKAASMVLGEKAVAVTGDSASLPPRELEAAKGLAAHMGVRLIVRRMHEVENPKYAMNPSNRCYYCKTELYAELTRIAKELGVSAVVDGTNADDLKDHRPGYLAAKEWGIRSPLAEVGLTKAEVRRVSRFLGLPTADKPAAACLASRIPYGEYITEERLRRVARAEEIVARLTGARQVRVRDHGDAEMARIEVARGERRLFFDEAVLDRLDAELRALGFTYVAFELSGYRPGSLDEVLTEKMIPSQVQASGASATPP